MSVLISSPLPIGHRLDKSLQEHARNAGVSNAFRLRRHGADHDREAAQSSQRH